MRSGKISTGQWWAKVGLGAAQGGATAAAPGFAPLWGGLSDLADQTLVHDKSLKEVDWGSVSVSAVLSYGGKVFGGKVGNKITKWLKKWRGAHIRAPKSNVVPFPARSGNIPKVSSATSAVIVDGTLESEVKPWFKGVVSGLLDDPGFSGLGAEMKDEVSTFYSDFFNSIESSSDMGNVSIENSVVGNGVNIGIKLKVNIGDKEYSGTFVRNGLNDGGNDSGNEQKKLRTENVSIPKG